MRKAGKGGKDPFALPPIKSADGGVYAPKKPKPDPASHSDVTTSAKKAAEEAEAAKKKGADEDSSEIQQDDSNGFIYTLAAAAVAANAGHFDTRQTAAHFWREAAKDMRHENTRRKQEWADWAEYAGDQVEQSKPKHREPSQAMDTDHPDLLADDVARYRKAVEWSKKKRDLQKEEAAKPKAEQASKTGNAGPLSKLDIALIAFEDEEEEKANGRKNKASWKKKDDDGKKKGKSVEEKPEKGKKKKGKKGKEEPQKKKKERAGILDD